MSIRKAVVALNTSTGNQDIEIGSGGKPSMFWAFASRATVSGTGVDTTFLGFFCGDGTDYWGQACSGQGGGQASSNLKYASFNSAAATTPRALQFLKSDHTKDGSISIAPRANWPTNGIRLVIEEALTAAYRIHLVFVDAQNAKVGTFTRNNTQNAATNVAPGFQAQTMGFGTQKGLLNNVSSDAWTDGGFFSFGMADDNGSTIDNMAVNYYETDNNATPSQNMEVSNTRCGWSNKLGGHDEAIEVTSVTAGGGANEIAVTSRDQIGNDLMGYFAIEWKSGVAHSLKAFNGPTSATSTNHTVSLGGATPEFMLICPCMLTAYDTPTQNNPASEALAFCHIDASTQDCICSSSQTGEADAYTKSFSTNSAMNVISMNGNDNSTVQNFVGSLTGMIANGVTINYTTATQTSAKMWGFAVQSSTTVPSAPQNLSALGESPTSVLLEWDAPVNDGGADIEGYKIQRESPVGGGFSTLVPNTGNTNLSYRDESLTTATQYNYKVSAINSIGEGAESSAANTTTPGAASNTKLSQINFALDEDLFIPLDDGGTIDQADRQHWLGVSRSPLADNLGNVIIAHQEQWALVGL